MFKERCLAFAENNRLTRVAHYSRDHWDPQHIILLQAHFDISVSDHGHFLLQWTFRFNGTLCRHIFLQISLVKGTQKRFRALPPLSPYQFFLHVFFQEEVTKAISESLQ